VTERRQCIIGTGYAGNGVAKADAGIPDDQLEKTDHVGGKLGRDDRARRQDRRMIDGTFACPGRGS
jgi:hypothetical protein